MKKAKKQNILVWLIPALLFFIGGFVAATFFDLKLSQAIYSPTNPFAIIWECFVWAPVVAPVFMLAMLLISRPKVWRKIWHIPTGMFLLLSVTAFCAYYIYSHMVKRGWLTGPKDILTWVLLAALLAIVGYYLWRSFYIQHHNYIKYLFFAVCSSIFSALAAGLCYGLKLLWQRTRFDEMMLAGGNLENFTPWYLPLAKGGSSFPSGHVAHFACIIVLVLLCQLFPQWEGKGKAIYFFTWAGAALMGYSRILIGRHFLSDTLAGFGLVLLLFFVLRRLPVYKKQLGETIKASRRIKKAYKQ